MSNNLDIFAAAKGLIEQAVEYQINPIELLTQDSKRTSSELFKKGEEGDLYSKFILCLYYDFLCPLFRDLNILEQKDPISKEQAFGVYAKIDDAKTEMFEGWHKKPSLEGEEYLQKVFVNFPETGQAKAILKFFGLKPQVVRSQRTEKEVEELVISGSDEVKKFTELKQSLNIRGK